MGRIICTYNVTEATESIKILNATGGVDNIYYNGNPIGVVQYYTFPTTGLHRLEFEESGIVQVGFANLDALVEVEIIGDEDSLYTSVQEKLFYGCANLKKVTLPNNLKYIYTASFYNCKSLQTITIPSSTERIYTSAFLGSGLEELIIEGCPNIELSAFAETNKLKTITCNSTTPPVITNTTFKLIAPNGTLNYPEGADYSSWLSTDGWYLGYYGWNTDNSSLLKCYYVWDDNGEVELFNETLTDSVNLIRVGTSTLTQEDGDLSNWYASWDWYDEESGYLVAYIRLNDMTTIPDYFFRYNAKLAKVEIPESITSLGKDVFYDTEKLNTIVCYSTTPPVIDESSYHNTFSFINRNGTLYYPEGADYSKWLSTEQGYLGYYGWNGVEIEVDEPDTPEPDDNEINIEVYVHNSPIVFGYQGGYKSHSISIGGNAFKDGLEVSEFKNLESSADWLGFSYDEGGTDDGKTYYYYFSFTCSENTNANQRKAICSGKYVLTDGRIGRFSFGIYQDANGIININGDNPLIFQAYEKGVTKETSVHYEGISSVGNTSFNNDIDGISVSHSSASTDSTGMVVDYEITMNKYNVYENDITGAIEYVLTNPDTGEDVIFEQQAVIRGCQYPFEVKKVIDGEYYDIDTKDGIKTIIVPAEGENLLLSTYFPFYMQGSTVEQNAYKRISFNKNGNSSITWSTSSNTYTDMYVGALQQDNFSIGFPKNTTEETKTASMEVQYTVKGGITYKDTVNFIQLIGNGEDVPYVTGTTTILYFNYDGTPKTSNEFDVYWYGDYYDRNIANDSSHFGISGKKIETTDEYVKYHYTVNCPQNTTSEVITGSCYFNIKLDASTYGESFVVEFNQDAKPNTNYSPEIEIEETTLEVSADSSSSYVDVTYVDMESYNPPEIMWGSNWFTLTTTTINNTETVRYFYTIAENNGVERSARVKFSGTGLDGENYEIYLDIIQDKKQQQTMADIRLNSYDIENGTLYFESSGDTKTVEAIVDGYTQPYSFNVNINASNNDVVLNKSELDYDNGKGYLIWVFEFQSKQNTNTKPSTGHITIDYEDGTGTYSTNLPFYIRYENEGIIHPYVSQITFKSDGSPENSGYDRFSVGYNGLGTVGDVTVDADWISVQEDGVESGGYYEEVYTYLVEVQPNTGQYREGHITLTMVDTVGSTKTTTILIKQKESAVVPDEPEPDYPESSDDETYSPIWKDVYYDFTYDSSYSIYTEVSRYINNQIGTIVEEQLLYSGKVFLPPDSESVKVMINKICQNYFENSYLPTDGSVGLIHNYKKFILKGEYGQVLHTYYFVNDWSYKELEVGIKTNPILPYIGDGQMLFFSAFADSREQKIKWGMRYYNGENDYVNTQYLTNGFETVIVAPSRQKGVNQFYFGNKVYSMIPKCRCQYVLYYTNPLGGYDWFPILGKVNKKDRITQYTYTNNYNNTTTDFGKYRYLTEITTHYTLNTGFLTEGQSLRMWELLESNCVYLHCLEENKIYPVIITSTEVDYKKKERGRKMLSYTIDVDYSQTRERI